LLQATVITKPQWKTPKESKICENLCNLWETNINPELLLKRGYSITLKDGKSIRSASQLKSGDIIETRLAEGSVKAKVE
jgi:exonuclease VII large subunit